MDKGINLLGFKTPMTLGKEASIQGKGGINLSYLFDYIKTFIIYSQSLTDFAIGPIVALRIDPLSGSLFFQSYYSNVSERPSELIHP